MDVEQQQKKLKICNTIHMGHLVVGTYTNTSRYSEKMRYGWTRWNERNVLLLNAIQSKIFSFN